MIILVLNLLFIFIYTIEAQTSPSSSPKCSPDVDGPVLDSCLKPLEKQWNITKKGKPQLEMMSMPLLGLDKKDMTMLCHLYQEAEQNCSREMKLCNHHQMALLAEKNFAYACRQDSDFRRESECVWSVIQNNQQCAFNLKKLHNTNDCVQTAKHFKCIQPFIQAQCKAKGVAALVHALDAYGCDTFMLDDETKLNECDQSDNQAVTTCFQPLLSFWAGLRQNDSNLDNVSYPLFSFKGADIVRMCDLINQIKDDCTQLVRCPGHPVPSFTNGLLALACGPQQSLFFLSFDCIRSAIRDNPRCVRLMPGVWNPGKVKESCWHVPPFFDCVKDQVLAKCSAEGLNVFAQSLKQFGCNVETTNWNGDWVALPPGVPHNFVNGSLQIQTTSPNSLFESQGLINNNAQEPDAFKLPDSFRPEPPRSDLNRTQLNNVLQKVFGTSKSGSVESVNGTRLASGNDALVGPPGLVPATNNALAGPPGLVPAPNDALVGPPGLVPASNNIVPSPTPTSSSLGGRSLPKPQLLPDEPNLSLAALANNQVRPFAPAVQPLSKEAQSTPVPVQVPVQLQIGVMIRSAEEEEEANMASGAFGSMTEPVDVCSKVRQCLQPLFTKWVQVQNNRNLSNLTFPMFHFDKTEIMELCDLYAAAFVSCNHSAFMACLRDEIVFLANSVFGYLCSPQNVVSFMKNYECITLTVRNRPICERPITGPLVMGRDLGVRCQGIHDYYVCNRLPIDRACGMEALHHVQETIKQFGCILEAS